MAQIEAGRLRTANEGRISQSSASRGEIRVYEYLYGYCQKFYEK
jgi:hypothetical protein